MAPKGKEIYNTIKRSLTTPPFGSGTAGSSNPSSVRYVGGSLPSSKQWIHPPDILLNGRVEYSVKMLGQTEVKEAKGTHVIRAAIHSIRFQLDVNKGVTGHSGAKLQKVDLQISVDGVTIVDSKTKMILFMYPLHRISFCADDKQDKRVFSFIAKAENSSRHDCFVFLSEKLAEQITLTIGEAFDLAYQKFLEKNGRELENKKQVIVLRKRIAELEAENNELKEKLSVYEKPLNGSMNMPSLPTSPVPKDPPPKFAKNIDSNILLPLVPPPSSSRRQFSTSTSNSNANKPEVGRKLENLDLDRMENLFDDMFDPRADERKQSAEKKPKDKFGLDPFGDDFMNDVLNLEANNRNTVGGDETKENDPTAEQLEQMLSLVDERLSELRDGFATGCLEMGDTGDSARDLQNIYNATQQSPSNDDAVAKPPEKSLS